jgi:hypothetical protein
MVNPATAINIPAAIVAHQGGWDEILLVVAPIALVLGLLALARRRVTHQDPNAADPASRPDEGAPLS